MTYTDKELRWVADECHQCNEDVPGTAGANPCCMSLGAVTRELLLAREAIESAKRNFSAWLAWHKAGLVGPNHAAEVLRATHEWMSDPYKAGAALAAYESREG